jgi:plastocyanin
VRATIVRAIATTAIVFGAWLVPSSALAAAAAVTIQNFTFTPGQVTVRAGDTVTWTNRDGAAHSAKFPSFSTPVLSQGQSASLVFGNAGTFNYICGIHGASMSGTVVVLAAATPPPTTPPPPPPTTAPPPPPATPPPTVRTAPPAPTPVPTTTEAAAPTPSEAPAATEAPSPSPAASSSPAIVFAAASATPSPVALATPAPSASDASPTPLIVGAAALAVLGLAALALRLARAR